MRHLSGKLCYGFLFVAVIPILLVFWDKGLQQTIPPLPLPGAIPTGWTLLITGGGLIISAWWALFYHGKGLPMNAYPPKYLVQRGIYALLPHPIYLGFVMAAGGYFMMIRSGAGFWIITPCTALAILALIYGYERHDMKKRFGTADWETFFGFPQNADSAPSPAERISAYGLIFIPWLFVYEAMIVLGPAPDAIESYFAFEYRWPVVEWTEAVYVLTYLFAACAPLCCRRKSDLRQFMLMGAWATAIGGLCFILIPLKASPRPFEISNIWGQLLMFERSMDGPAGAFPSFHAIWALLAAWLYARSFKMKPLWYTLAAIFSISCLTTGMHSLADILAAFLVFILTLNGKWLWHSTLQCTETIANSWKTWQIGKVRIIIHGVYAGAGAAIGILLAAHLAGAPHLPYILLAGLISLIGAGIWGQFIEGSSKLSRPFGYYGSLFGCGAGILGMAAMGSDGWLIAGAFSVAGPFIQAIGRLRCLVQGCCHGRECRPHQGISFTNPNSRVLYLANLGHRPVYPTQLYSILYNLILGPLLLRAWMISAPMPLIVGGYLILSSLGRFVEEAYRGEPQTPQLTGIKLYQWLSLIGVITGIILTTLEGQPANIPVTLLPETFIYSALFGLITTFVMGVDFPDSNKRFSRLT